MRESSNKKKRIVKTTPASAKRAMQKAQTVGSLREALEWLPGGVEWAMRILSTLGWERLEREGLQEVLGEWHALTEIGRNRLNLDEWLRKREINPAHFFGLISEAAMQMGYQMGQVLAAAAQPALVAASLENALNDKGERGEWMKAYGHHLVPKGAEININQQFNQQNITAQSAVERGLPAFHETLADADSALKHDEPLALTAGPNDLYTLDLEEDDADNQPARLESRESTE